MMSSDLKFGKNLQKIALSLPDGHICSVYISALIAKEYENEILWPELIADLLAGEGINAAAAGAGRGGIFFFSDHRVPSPLVVRQYRHGGFWRFLSGARFFSKARFLAEFAIHNRAAALDIPVPEAVAVIVVKKSAHPVFVTGYFATLKLPECQTLPEFLDSAAAKTRLMIFFKLGGYLNKLHAAGIFYTDMHVKNILVNCAGEPCFIDFDKSRDFKRPLSERLRRINLQRFWRSLEKFSSRGGCLVDSDRAAFLTAYAPNCKRYTYLVRKLNCGRIRRSIFYRLGWLLNRS